MNSLKGTLGIIRRTPQRASTRAVGTIAAALVVSVSLNVLLAHRVRSLTAARSATFAERLLKAGAAVPPIQAMRLGGQQEVISYGGTNQTTVLYIFTPPCIWCARNMDNLKTLLANKSGQYRFVGLSLSENGLAEYVTKNDLNLPVYSGLYNDTREAYKLSGTPQQSSSLLRVASYRIGSERMWAIRRLRLKHLFMSLFPVFAR